MNLTELKEEIEKDYFEYCENHTCAYGVEDLNKFCKYGRDITDSCHIVFALEYLSQKGLLNKKVTVEDVELDFHKLEKVRVDVELGMPDPINEDLFFKELNERKSEFLKIKGKE